MNQPREIKPAARLAAGWPGLPQLWQGDRAGLWPAVAFAAALNFILLANFIWFAAIPVAVRVLSGALLIWISARRLSQPVQPTVSAPEEATPEMLGLFLRAQGEYLSGHWYEAESLLTELLTCQPDDPEARLLLATLCRRTARPQDALRHLEHLERIDHTWEYEIQLERAWLRCPAGDAEAAADRNDDTGSTTRSAA